MVKQKSVIWLVVFCSLVCMAAVSIAQPVAEKGQPFIVNFNPKTLDYYPQNWSCAEDKRGLMYFGNGVLILQYDGATWRKIPLSGSIQQTARALASDHEGRIFYGSIGDFGYLAADSSGNTKCVSLVSNVPAPQRNFFDIWSIYEAGNDIYFQTRDYIFRLTKTMVQSKETWKVKTWPAGAKFMYAFYEDGTYYVHEQNAGLFKMVNDSLVLIPGSEFLGKDRVQVMLPYANNDGKQSYLIGMFYSGIYLFDGDHFTRFKTEADDIIKSALLYKGLLLKNGSYALSTIGKGLIIIDRNGKILQKINRDVGLQDESVYAVYEDAQSNLWLALDNGISRVETSMPLTQFTLQSGVSSSTLAVKRYNGALYLGTSNGLMKFDSSTRMFKAVAEIPQTQVFKLFQEGHDLLIPSDGLFRINDKGLHLIRRSTGGDLQIACLFVSKKNPNILYAGNALGVSVFMRTKKNGQEDWSFIGVIPKIDEATWTMVEKDDGGLWVGTINSNVYKVNLKFGKNGEPDLKNTTTKVFGVSNGLKFGSGPVFMIKNQVYFPADSTISIYDEHDQQFHVDTTFGRFKNGGGSNEFYMTEDSSGRVWLRVGKMFRLATPQPNGTYKLTDKTGLSPIADGTIAQLYPEKDGTIWACSTDGLIRYNANVSKNYDQSFRTLLRSIHAGTTFLDPAQDSMHNEQLIPYTSNSIRFEYASPFYAQEQKTKYQTWLEGFDKTWSAWGNNYYKEYTNLPDAKYAFHVRALNVFENTSTEALYHFEISAPWYRTWWAYMLYIVTLGMLLSLFIRNRSRALIRKNKVLEEKVANRTKQLNTSIEVLKSTQAQLIQSEKMASLGELTAGIAHEIQNPLNFVNNFSEVSNELIDEIQEERAKPAGTRDEQLQDTLLNDIKQNLEKINHHGKRADAIVKGMLQHSRSSTGSNEPTDINALADEYLRLAYHGLRAKDKEFNATIKTDFDKNVEKVNIVPQDMGRAFLNLYTNAFYAVAEKKKQQPLNYDPVVSVSTRQSASQVSITVSDNGNGIPQKIIDKIFQPFFTTKPTGQGTGLGLSLSYDIIKAHSGEIKVLSKENEGTEFVIELPLLG